MRGTNVRRRIDEVRVNNIDGSGDIVALKTLLEAEMLRELVILLEF